MKLGYVSIIIPTYNSNETIVQAIESVFNQTFKNFEIIVVDDGSIDNTQAVLAPYIERGLIHYFFKENGGPSSARNVGISNATGEYVAFLDADDYWHPEKLSKQVEVFKKSPNCIVCYTQITTVNYDGEVNKFKFNKSQKSGYILGCLIFSNIVPLSSAIIRNDILNNVGFFDEDPGVIYVEDYDLWLRVAPLGDFCSINEPLTFYRLPSKFKNTKPNYDKVIKIFYKNMIRSYLKYKTWYFFGLVLNIMKKFFYKTGLKFIFISVTHKLFFVNTK